MIIIINDKDETSKFIKLFKIYENDKIKLNKINLIMNDIKNDINKDNKIINNYHTNINEFILNKYKNNTVIHFIDEIYNDRSLYECQIQIYNDDNKEITNDYLLKYYNINKKEIKYLKLTYILEYYLKDISICSLLLYIYYYFNKILIYKNIKNCDKKDFNKKKLFNKILYNNLIFIYNTLIILYNKYDKIDSNWNNLNKNIKNLLINTINEDSNELDIIEKCKYNDNLYKLLDLYIIYINSILNCKTNFNSIKSLQLDDIIPYIDEKIRIIKNNINNKLKDKSIISLMINSVYQIDLIELYYLYRIKYLNKKSNIKKFVFNYKIQKI